MDPFPPGFAIFLLPRAAYSEVIAGVSEALAEGMTVVDYSPGSLIVEDYGSLSTWLRNLSAPAGSVFRGHRWSERSSGRGHDRSRLFSRQPDRRGLWIPFHLASQSFCSRGQRIPRSSLE